MHDHEAAFVLFATEHCHLCEQARDVLLACGLGGRYTLVDISDDDQLMARYGLRIPVLAGGARELDWPFDEHAVHALLATAGEHH